MIYWVSVMTCTLHGIYDPAMCYTHSMAKCQAKCEFSLTYLGESPTPPSPPPTTLSSTPVTQSIFNYHHLCLHFQAFITTPYAGSVTNQQIILPLTSVRARPLNIFTVAEIMILMLRIKIEVLVYLATIKSLW